MHTQTQRPNEFEPCIMQTSAPKRIQPCKSIHAAPCARGMPPGHLAWARIHAMPGKASTRTARKKCDDTLRTGTKPAREAPGRPHMPSRHLEPSWARVAAQRGRRRTPLRSRSPRSRVRAIPLGSEKMPGSEAGTEAIAAQASNRRSGGALHPGSEAGVGTPNALNAKPPPQAHRELERQPGESAAATNSKRIMQNVQHAKQARTATRNPKKRPTLERRCKGSRGATP